MEACQPSPERGPSIDSPGYAPSGYKKQFVDDVSGLVYSFAFVVLQVGGRAPDLGVGLSSLSLMAGGVLSTAALVALYHRLRDQEEPWALWGLLLGLTAALGSAIHGGWDLANALHPPATLPPADVPSQIDPRGLLTFALAGLSLLVFGRLIAQSARFPKGLALLTFLSATLMIVVYLGRLIVLTPTSPLVLGPAALLGFIVNPAWYIWLGLELRRGAR